MGATAENRLARRRIHELEEKLKKLQRVIQHLKSQNRKMGSLRKQVKTNQLREEDLRELLEFNETLAFHVDENNVQSGHAERCRTENCLSQKVTLVAAGCRTIVICNQCSSRYSFQRMV